MVIASSLTEFQAHTTTPKGWPALKSELTALGVRYSLQEAGLKLLRSHRGLGTIFGNCGPGVLRGRRHNDSREHEQPMRRGGCSLAQPSPRQRSSKNFPEECVQRPTR